MSDPTAPTWKGGLIALLIGLVLMAAASEGVLRIVMPNWKEFFPGHFMHRIEVKDHPALYVGQPGFEGYFSQNNGDFRHTIRINDFGLRNDEPIDAADNRIWVIGDSMAFGWGVEREQTYTAVIAELTMPTYNLASPGADVCGYQGLAARVPETIQPRAVIVGLILENDIYDYDCVLKTREEKSASREQNDDMTFNLQYVKGTLTIHSALYNFLAVQLKRQAWVNDTLIALGVMERPHKLRNIFPEDELEARTKATASELLKLRKMFTGIPFSVLVAPARFEIRDDEPFYKKLRLTMIDALTEVGLTVIDPLPGFKEEGFEATHFVHDGHWSPLGHKVAAKAAAQWLQQQGAGN